jgi:hypothetical protein
VKISGWGRGCGLAAAVAVSMAASAAAADDHKGSKPDASQSIAEATAKLEARPGLLPVYLDIKGGRVLVALPCDDKGDCGTFLYQVYMRSGLGSTPVGLDRSAPAQSQVISFRRTGKKVMAELQNNAFRADGGGAEEKSSVHDSFPPSIVWAGDISAEDKDGSVLVDVSSFLTRDAFNAAEQIKATDQGSFKPSKELSYPDVAAVQAFPDNLEMEAHQTFTSDEPGREVQGLAPEPHSITLVEHHSLIRLPAPGFKPRLADPRTGAIADLVIDFSAPLDKPLARQYAHRFRLEKIDPSAARSPVKKPIVFYVDRGAPEPVRTALIEGARWWNQAFEAAGFIDAFRVDILPEGVSPLDARYNVINWVHRQTRGWSYGANIIDPRTGEIVKAVVLLGSQRVRQDRIIFEGLEGADKTGKGGPNDPLVIALARLRQLAVHESGHGIGLEHNMAGSTFDDRASVMDYPPPRVKITASDQLDFSDAYQVGVGSWDRFAIKWLYSEFPEGTDEAAALDAIVRDGYAHGLRYASDEDARPTGSAQPNGALWDDGTDSVAGLEQALKVRRIALGRFGLANLPAGAPISDLRRVIVPIYLFHRYEVASVAKSVGGIDFIYGVNGDGRQPSRPVPAAQQRRALTALLATLDPALLDLPDPLINQLSGGREGAGDPQYLTEVFGDSRTPVFDIGSAAATAADITLSEVLNPARLNRVADLGGRDSQQLQLSELLAHTVAAAWPTAAANTGRAGLIRRSVQARLVARLAGLLEDKSLSPTATAEVRAALTALGHRLALVKAGDAADVAQAAYYAQIILNPARDELHGLVEADKRRALEPPPGMPIGSGEDCWFCETVGLGR